MFYHDFLSFRTCTTENTPNTIFFELLTYLNKVCKLLIRSK